MRQYSILFILTALFVAGCGVSVKHVSLQDDFKGKEGEKEFKDVGIPALQYQSGTIDDFSEGIYSWWTGSNATSTLSLDRADGALKVVAENVGPKYNPFGRQVPGLDLSGDLVIKVRARAEENAAKLRIDNKDIAGTVANGNPPVNKIQVSDEFKDYYYPLKGTFVQSWPDNAEVDARNISEMMFFLNPGGPGYTGTLYIDEVSVIKKEDMPKQSEQDAGPVGVDSLIIGNFTDGNKDGWWGDDKFTLTTTKEDVLKVDVNGAGPDYQPFGAGMKRLNMKHAHKIVVWARAEAEEEPLLRIDVKDPKGYTTNAQPAQNSIHIGDEFKKYVFNYKGGFLQTYPDRQDVDAERIEEMLCFVNPGGEPFKGTIYIDKVEAKFTGIPEDEKAGGEEKEEVDTSKPMVIDDFSKEIYSWWSVDAVQLDRKNKTLVAQADQVGAEEPAFGRGFRTINFKYFPIVAVQVKAEKPVDLRLDVKDLDAYTTNAQPITKQIEAAEDYQTVYFDFRDKFRQDTPEDHEVDPTQILELEAYLKNPDGDTYSGKVMIKNIQALSPELLPDNK